MSDFFCVNENCSFYLKPCPVDAEDDGDGYVDFVCEACRHFCHRYREKV